ncbi:alpha-amylase family glycosyl hydrolase [Faecalibacter macacae]|uniref:T9SS C-terminal target domain-containing protein n=1 Tax=Faecalibacter macacae TaxID=1859289 RepID=A0A3L9MIH1_9FLAO|nr:alpha-amylase family glycosyl hydrolase [Faecalibacter macacae]RLZ12641.1 T9SS C-terminal target domain-containing protein [Faecalibacter macacae]
MRNIMSIILGLFTIIIQAQVSTNPNPLEADLPATIYFDKANTNLASYSGDIYAHTGVTINGNRWQNVIGNWGNNTTQPKLTYVSGTIYKLEIPTYIRQFYGVDTSTNITEISFVFRNAQGNLQTNPDIHISVGGFRVQMIQPAPNSITNVTTGNSFTIHATSTLAANWRLSSNGNVIQELNNTTIFNRNYTINSNQDYTLSATNPITQEVISNSFKAFLKPTVITQAIPQNLKQGINYTNDHTKAYLVLFAPQKEFIHVIGSFNNWNISNDYVMKRDTSNPDLYWIEINNLNPGEIYSFQYRTSDGIKTADPYSTLVLSPYDDQYISTSSYPNLPIYPNGQEFEVSILQTNAPSYQWNVQNFAKPNKENLIIYELLIRDFNTAKTWESLIDDFDYFKNLNVNAIEIMPVMEFEGNISWGYNTAYHLALDKAYGPANKMKEFIDLCHQNGIAVILDIALNHVYGRSPLVRMWMNDPDGDGFGEPTNTNPYVNTEAKHSYNVGYDLNHQLTPTQHYVNRTIEYWIKEFKIDGIRWDLTKGFTQNCSLSDENCTNSYQQDRVNILKQYADYQWSVDPTSYIIFEHLGQNGSAQEETEWANYRNNEGKGIMLWGKATHNFNQNTMGYAEESNFNWLKHTEKGFNKKHLIVYAESHDEERLMHKNLQWGAQEGTYNVKNLTTALERQKAVGAILFMIPGPKMIWQFSELGYDFSINYCNNGTTNEGCRTDPKPIPGEIGYLTNQDRTSVYDTWAKIIEIRLNNEVFNTDNYTISSGDLKPRISISNPNLTETELKDVIVVANFTTSTQTISPQFPYNGTWYNLMDESTINVNSTDFTLQLNPGEFRIFGNKSTLNIVKDSNKDKLIIYPNPTKNGFRISENTKNVRIIDLSGKTIKSFNGNFKKDNFFSTHSINRGIYLIEIKNSIKTYVQKLVIK